MDFIFKTTTTMKPHNCKKWWIDSNVVKDIEITAENLHEALKQYREILEKQHYIIISDHAMKNKSPLFIDIPNKEAKQVGYVITGKTDFEDRDKYKWSVQYIDLWVTILTVIDTEF